MKGVLLMNEEFEKEKRSKEDTINERLNSAIISSNNVKFESIISQLNNKKVVDYLKSKNKLNKMTFLKKLTAACVAVLIFSAILYVPFKLNNYKNIFSENGTEILPTIKDNTMLQSMLKTNENRAFNADSILAPQVQNSGAAEKGLTSDLVSSDSYSKTNVQVSGVDEADIIKTDGKFIYYISNKTVFVVDINDSSNMSIKTKIAFSATEQPIEMYIDDTTMTILCSDYIKNASITKIKVYDINDKSNVTIKKEFSCDGYYTSSRKIGDYVYFVGNKAVYATTDIATILPQYSDSGKSVTIAASDIRYFPNDTNPNSFFYVAAINTADVTKPVVFKSYLGSAYNVYSSQTALFLTGAKYLNNGSETAIYKFAISNDEIACVASASAPGYIINQFSMDEFEGNFRIATNNNNSNNVYVFDNNLKIVGKLEGLAEGESIYSVRFLGKKVYIVTFKTVDPLFVIDLSDPTKPTVLGELKIPGYSTYLHPYDETHIIGFGMDTVDTSGNRAMTGGLKIAMFDVTDVNNPKELFNTVIGQQGTYSDLLNNHKALLFSKEKNIIGFPVTMNTQVQTQNGYVYTNYQGFNLYDIDFTKGFVLRGSITHYDANSNNNTGVIPYPAQTGTVNETKPAYAQDYGTTSSKAVAPDAVVAPDYNASTSSSGSTNGSTTAVDPSSGSSSGSATSDFVKDSPSSMPMYMYNNSVVSRGIYVGDVLYTFSPNKIVASKLSDLTLIQELVLDAYSK